MAVVLRSVLENEQVGTSCSLEEGARGIIGASAVAGKTMPGDSGWAQVRRQG